MCAEAAVVGIPDEITGQSVVCFCVLKSPDPALAQALKNHVRVHIGPFATPKRIVIVPDLPKTRSGKIMRRIIRKIASKDIVLKDAYDAAVVREKLGDISTLADPSIVAIIIECFSKPEIAKADTTQAEYITAALYLCVQIAIK